MTKDEALRMALETLEGMYIPNFTMYDSPINNAITAIKEALAQPEQEPVAWIDSSGHPKHLKYVQGIREKQLYGELKPLYTTPPQRKPLTDEMKKQCPYTAYPSQQAAFMEGWLKAEAAHGIKENT